MQKLLENFYGIIFVVFLVVFSKLLSEMFLLNNIFVSSAFISILLGLMVGNFFQLNKQIQWFAELSLKKILRVGIAFLGIGLSVAELIEYGSISIFLVIMNIVLVFIILFYLCKLFKIPKTLGYLITMGTSICGVTAVIATSSIIKAKKNETSYAVAIVTLFGIITVFTYPYLAHYLFKDFPEFAGVFLGTSINDTAQVSAAGYIYSENYNSESALNASMTTKLLRNSFLVFLIPLIAYMSAQKDSLSIKGSIKSFFPLFVIGFIFFSLVRSLGDQFIIDDNLVFYWEKLIDLIKTSSKYCILLAMVSLGLQTNIKELTQLGYKPLIIGFVASISIGIISIIFLKNFV